MKTEETIKNDIQVLEEKLILCQQKLDSITQWQLDCDLVYKYSSEKTKLKSKIEALKAVLEER